MRVCAVVWQKKGKASIDKYDSAVYLLSRRYDIRY